MYSALAAYCFLIILASIVGGWLPSLVKLTHRRTQLILSLVAGVMLGVALLHLLPESIHVLQSAEAALAIALVGLLFMFFLIRLFHFHQHDSHAEDQDCEAEHVHLRKAPGHSAVSWAGLALGLTIHSVIDGIALAAAVTAHSQQGTWMQGVGIFLAVALHKPLDALSVISLMGARGASAQRQRIVNLLFSLTCPLGALLFIGGFNLAGSDQALPLGIALAFAAGVFVCISLSDLLPEVQFHSHDRFALSGMLLLGIAIAVATELLPGHRHDGQEHKHTGAPARPASVSAQFPRQG